MKTCHIYPLYLKDCEKCGQKIFAKNSGFNKPTRKYCSKSCRASVNNKVRIWKEESKKKISKAKLTHGYSNNPLHKVWLEMKRRCLITTCVSYKNYGGRGIKVSKEWMDINKFIIWANNNGYKKGLTLERINNNGDYCKENCKWIPRKDQSKNRRPYSEWSK